MTSPRHESVQPIPVSPPSEGVLLFAIRCLIDLQLGTIVKYLRPALATLPPGNVLDVGAGQSPWRGWLPAGCAYTGIDVAYAADFKIASPADITVYDGTNIPFPDGWFDSAICIEVLEHAEHPERLIAEIARVLKDGAPLLLTVPWSARRHHIPHDFHRFTRERLAMLFEHNGFTGIDIVERGNDISAIANKLVVATVRTMRSASLKNALLVVPLFICLGTFSAVMLLASHLSMFFGLGSLEDPLGYFCRAYKRNAVYPINVTR
jgi:SAM-dependent methyltransferase